MDNGVKPQGVWRGYRWPMRKPPHDQDDPVSIPLDPEEALKALLKVKPDDEPRAKKAEDSDLSKP